jgi:hypothetical protein
MLAGRVKAKQRAGKIPVREAQRWDALLVSLSADPPERKEAARLAVTTVLPTKK